MFHNMNNALNVFLAFNNKIASAAMSLAVTGSNDELLTLELDLATLPEHYFGACEDARAVCRLLRELAYRLAWGAEDSVIESIENQLEVRSYALH